jgi:hypothetical protein
MLRECLVEPRCRLEVGVWFGVQLHPCTLEYLEARHSIVGFGLEHFTEYVPALGASFQQLGDVPVDATFSIELDDLLHIRSLEWGSTGENL